MMTHFARLQASISACFLWDDWALQAQTQTKRDSKLNFLSRLGNRPNGSLFFVRLIDSQRQNAIRFCISIGMLLAFWLL